MPVAGEHAAGQAHRAQDRRRGQTISARSAAARRNPTSKPALWATSTAPRANSRNAGSTESIVGASHTMAVVMPVNDTIWGGMLRPGSTRGGELAQHHAAAHLDRTDLGDGVVVLAAGAATRGLEVDDDERRFAQ